MAVVIIWVTMEEDRRMENEDSGTEVKLTFVMVKNNDSIKGHVKKKSKRKEKQLSTRKAEVRLDSVAVRTIKTKPQNSRMGKL